MGSWRGRGDILQEEKGMEWEKKTSMALLSSSYTKTVTKTKYKSSTLCSLMLTLLVQDYTYLQSQTLLPPHEY